MAYNGSKMDNSKMNKYVVGKNGTERGKRMDISIEFLRKIGTAYSSVCKPLCQRWRIPQTAFDILMFLVNNPQYKTARDIVEIRKIKANLVSVNVDRLVTEGYLERKAIEGDRRKLQLVCTRKAEPLTEEGRKLQQDFLERLFVNTREEDKKGFLAVMQIMEQNLDDLLKGEK